MKRIAILSTFIIVIAFTCLIYWKLHKEEKANGFNRKMHKDVLKSEKQIDLEKEYYILSHFSPDFIYLWTYNEPASLKRYDYNLKKYPSILLPPNKNEVQEKSPGYKTFDVEEPYVFQTNGKTHTYSVFSFLDSTTYQKTLDSVKFNQAIHLSKNKLVVRSVEKRNGGRLRVLKKFNTDVSQNPIKVFKLEKQSDGFFCTDGSLTYDRTGKIIYVYAYRGEFICLDTNFNMLYKAKTIDTVTRANIKIAKQNTTLEDGTFLKSTVLKGKAPLVNKFSCVSNGLLFINSALVADNENKNIDDITVIDVYSLSNGNYRFSFYLPSSKENRLKSFKVCNDKLVALNMKTLSIYNLNLPLIH